MNFKNTDIITKFGQSYVPITLISIYAFFINWISNFLSFYNLENIKIDVHDPYVDKKEIKKYYERYSYSWHRYLVSRRYNK